jgi:hypothetical protein
MDKLNGPDDVKIQIQEHLKSIQIIKTSGDSPNPVETSERTADKCQSSATIYF